MPFFFLKRRCKKGKQGALKRNGMHFQRITNKFMAFLVALGLLLLNNGGFRHVIAQRRNLSAERAGKQAAQIKYYISRKGKEGREGKCNHSRASYLYLDLKKCSPPLSDLQPVLLWTCCPWKRDVVHLRLHRFWLLLFFLFFQLLVLGKHYQSVTTTVSRAPVVCCAQQH